MKRICLILLCVGLAFSATSCSNQEEAASSLPSGTISEGVSSESAESHSSLLPEDTIPDPSSVASQQTTSTTSKQEEPNQAPSKAPSSQKAPAASSSSKAPSASSSSKPQQSKPSASTAPSSSSSPRPSIPKPSVSSPSSPSSSSSSVSSSKPNTSTPNSGSKAQQVANLVNQERAKAGLKPLTFDAELSANALVRAKEIVTKFDHTRPDGSKFSTAITIPWKTVGENIAWGQTTPQAVMNAWMNSEGHRANILKPSFTKIGVGVYEKNGRLYWVQLFAG